MIESWAVPVAAHLDGDEAVLLVEALHLLRGVHLHASHVRMTIEKRVEPVHQKSRADAATVPCRVDHAPAERGGLSIAFARDATGCDDAPSVFHHEIWPGERVEKTIVGELLFRRKVLRNVAPKKRQTGRAIAGTKSGATWRT